MNITLATPLRTSLIALALSSVFGAFAADAPSTAPLTKDEYTAAKKQIDTDYTADEKACGSSTGNAKDVCKEEAKAKRNNAKADLEARYTGKPTDHEKAAKVHAESDYAVAKEKCDDLKGNDKDVCVKEAKAAKTKALADLKADQKSAKAHNAAAADKADADYAVAKEKCDALSGPQKDQCLADAKARFGK